MEHFKVYLLDENGNVPANAQPIPCDDKGYVAVEEFDNWVVCEINPTGRDLYMRWEDDYHPLERSETLQGFIWPTHVSRKWRHVKGANRTAGYLTLHQPDIRGVYRPLRPILYIVAGSISESEYALLLDRLGQLAVTSRSGITAPVEGRLPVGLENAGKWVSMPMLSHALAVLDFWSVFRQKWAIIVRNPVSQARRIPQHVRANTPIAQRSPKALRQMVAHPGRNRLWLPLLQEDMDTPENRFIAFALNSLSSQAKSLGQAFNGMASRFEQDLARPPKDAGDHAQRLWNQGRATARQAADELRHIAAHLCEAEEWASVHLRTPFLTRSVAAARPPRQPSLQLTRSPGYGAIYAAYRRIFASDETEVKLDTVRRGLMTRAVRTTHELYELWLFLETYALLVERFGFRPDGEEPVAHLEMQMGCLKLERKQTYALRLHLENNTDSPDYYIYLTYEPQVEYTPCTLAKSCFIPGVCQRLRCYEPHRKPYPHGPDLDVVTEHNGERHRFAIDAKYRDYAAQPLFQGDAKKYGYETTFDNDVLGTAKQKYLNGIGYEAAFVVHSDAVGKYTYFGDTLFPVKSHREEAAGLPAYPGHRYGAVFAVPWKTGNLERLLKCLLMYHAGWYDICWICRRRLLCETHEQWNPPGRVSTYFQCKHGHGFWAISHCQGPEKHRLIKLGEESFHRTKPGNVWNCECPECGDVLGERRPTIALSEESIPF